MPASLLVGVLLAALGQSPSATVQSDTTRTLQIFYDRALQLTTKKDIPTLEQLYRKVDTPDYVFISKGGTKHGRAEILRAMAGVLSNFDITTANVHIDNLTLSGSSALAKVTTTVQFVSRSGVKKKRHTVGQKVQGQDSWILQGTEWRLKCSKVSTETTTVDGKIVKS